MGFLADLYTLAVAASIGAFFVYILQNILLIVMIIGIISCLHFVLFIIKWILDGIRRRREKKEKAKDE